MELRHIESVGRLDRAGSFRSTGSMCLAGWPLSVTLCDVPEDAISIGGVDLTDPDTYVSGMPFDAFRELRTACPRRVAPV